MSDTPQEPDWWRASDDKWYPPARGNSQPLPPPPHESKSQARLRKTQAKLRTEVQALLEPGEQLQAVFVSQTGPHGISSWGLGSNLVRYWSVTVTDRNIVLCPFGRKGKPTRLPRERLEVPEAWGRGSDFPVVIGGTQHWVASTQFDIVAAANECLRAEQGASLPVDTTEPAAGTPGQPAVATSGAWYPDPIHRHQLRYKDGESWTAYVADQGTQSMDPIKTS